LRPAARVFADEGFDDARIEDLTGATGIPSSTLYYYFGGKRDILVFLLEDFLDAVATNVRVAAAGPGPARHRLEEVIRTQLGLMASQPDTCRVLLAELGRLGRLPDTAKAMNEAFHEPVQELLRAGASDGSLRDLRPDATASAIFGALTVTALHYLVSDQPLAVDATAAALLSLLADGYAAPTPSGSGTKGKSPKGTR
jgi:AcrR family transcriptional regulator